MPWSGTGTPAAGGYDLTTLVKAKRYLRITTTTDDTLLGELIDSASALIESICDRNFLSRNYAELYDGNGSEYLYLKNWPATAVSRLSLGCDQVLGVGCNATGATWASMRSDGTNLILVYDTSAGVTTTNLALGTYTTITLLAAAINATSGWRTSSTGDFGNYLTADILDCPALYCLDGYAYLITGYKAEDDWKWEEETGRMYLVSGFEIGTQNIYVEYTAGYASVPADLELIANEVVAWMYYLHGRDPGLSSERLGDYGWTAKAGDEDYVHSLESRLSRYKRVAI